MTNKVVAGPVVRLTSVASALSPDTCIAGRLLKATSQEVFLGDPDSLSDGVYETMANTHGLE